MTNARRRVAAIAGLIIAALALSACTYYQPPDPPDVVAESVERALEGIRGLPGIGEADVDVSPADSSTGGDALDDPLRWIARFSVETDGEPDLLRVATAIDTELETLRDTVPAIAYLSDDRPGEASAQLELGPQTMVAAGATSSVAQAVDAAAALRTVPTLDSLWVSTYPDPVRADVRSPDDWTASVAGIRGLPGFGGAGMVSATITTNRADGRHASLSLDAASPSDGVTEALVDIVAQPAVTSLRFDGVRTVAELTQVWRPRLMIDTTSKSTANEVAGLLAALPDAVPAGAPRPAFQIWLQNGADDGVSGYVGLPLGSPEPLDALPVPVVEPPPIDPAVAAAQLEAARVLIHELFAEAGTVAGIAGTSTVDTIPCDTGRGEQVQARTLIPVFEIGDSADAPFAAIIDAWGDRGYEYADRGMGTDFYAADGLERLTIRGGVDGISINAVGLCTG